MVLMELDNWEDCLRVSKGVLSECPSRLRRRLTRSPASSLLLPASVLDPASGSRSSRRVRSVCREEVLVPNMREMVLTVALNIL